MLAHQKMTGHFMLGEWKQVKGKWQAKNENAFAIDKANKYIRFIFFLDNKEMMAFSDLRKFGSIRLGQSADFKELSKMGPEPLDASFSYKIFCERLNKKKNGKIKQVLMDQEIIAGIGNIYSDEILWRANVDPFRLVKTLSPKELRAIYSYIKSVLAKAVELRGESFSDYRDLFGEKGNFDKIRKVYKRQGENCSKCKTIICKKKIGGRSTCYCPKCQK
jgi:formamidopyrimidine-DNA glycosylase